MEFVFHSFHDGINFFLKELEQRFRGQVFNPILKLDLALGGQDLSDRRVVVLELCGCLAVV